jgi:excisionase family DNA binding protein
MKPPPIVIRPGDRLMTIDEVAALLVVPKSTLYQWQHRREHLVGMRIGRHLRYAPADVAAFLNRLRGAATAA